MNLRAIAVDIDGTLFTHNYKLTDKDYVNGAALRAVCEPRTDAINLIRAFHALGIRIAYVTGRTEAVRAETIEQLHDAGCPPGSYHFAPRWNDWDSYITRKAHTIHILGADAYLGDLDADAVVAARAGCAYLDVNTIIPSCAPGRGTTPTGPASFPTNGQDAVPRPGTPKSPPRPAPGGDAETPQQGRSTFQSRTGGTAIRDGEHTPTTDAAASLSPPGPADSQPAEISLPRPAETPRLPRSGQPTGGHSNDLQLPRRSDTAPGPTHAEGGA